LPSSLRCHPERGRFLADEGPAVRFASFLVLLRFSFCFVSRFASLFGFAGFYPGDRKAEVCPAKSSHVGFVFSISAIFLARLQPLISFSRRIAALMSVKTS
jgi:hypothetical protein